MTRGTQTVPGMTTADNTHTYHRPSAFENRQDLLESRLQLVIHWQSSHKHVVSGRLLVQLTPLHRGCTSHQVSINVLSIDDEVESPNGLVAAVAPSDAEQRL